MTYYGRDTVIEIDLDVFEKNISLFRNTLPQDTQILVAVKADGYGHGAVPIAEAALQAGASYLGVAFVDEGIELRKAGIKAPILILGYTPREAMKDILEYDLTCTIFTREHLNNLQKLAAIARVNVKVHIKVDTGMSRLGATPKEVLALLELTNDLEMITVEGLYTHLATSDEKDSEYLYYQEKVFLNLVNEVIEQKYHIPLIHIANSGGAIQIPKNTYNMVRLGISAYGYYPSPALKSHLEGLQPILTFKSKLTQVKKLPKGAGISYGKTYVTSGEEWIGTVPIGYGDGFSRLFSNKGSVLVKGKKVPIVGKICMDQLMINVSRVMPVKVGEEVVIYGKQKGCEISINEIASELSTITYEVTSRLSHRIPRIYYRDGKEVGVYNRIRSTEYTRMEL